MTNLLLQPVEPAYITTLWIDALHQQLVSELASATQGQCLRVVDLPRRILEGVATRFLEADVQDSEVYLVDRQAGPEPWRVGVHKVVERRNADVILLALFPPDLQLAAGDSVDVSTFRAIKVDDLPQRIVAGLKGLIPPRLFDHASTVMSDLRRRGRPLTDSAVIEFLATIVAQNSDDPSVVGGALYTLGLFPDFALLERPEEFHYRLGQRNIPAIRQLCEDVGTPLERILRLPITDAQFRERLVSFFNGRRTEDISTWGRTIATDAQWRDLALDRWPQGEIPRPSGMLRIDIEPLKLARRKEDGLLLFDGRSGDVRVAWQTNPPPMDVPGLAYFRVEVVDSDRQVVWESPLLKNSGGKTAKRQRSVKGLNLDTGIYFFRVIALDTAGDSFPQQPLRDPNTQRIDGMDPDIDGSAASHGKRINESEDFLLLADEDDEPDDDVEPVTNVLVDSFAEAELLYRGSTTSAKKDPTGVRVQAIEWATAPGLHGETAAATIRFDLQHQYSLRLSQRLRALEERILQTPDNGGHFTMRIRPISAERITEERGLALPADLREARRAVLAAIAQTRLTNDPELGSTPVVALVDLLPMRLLIEQYASAYRQWLETGDLGALRLDVTLLTMQDLGEAALVAPTHPLRLLWLMQKQQLARHWSMIAAQRTDTSRTYIDVWRHSLKADALPAIVVVGTDEGYVEAGSLGSGWGVYLPPSIHDPLLLLSAIRKRFGVGSGQEADMSARLLTDKCVIFLRQHPYVETLTINVVNPGDAALIRDALIELERRDVTGPMRYDVRLFTNGIYEEGVGEAFRDLADPDSPIAAVADRLMRPGPSFLFPKLSWSRYPLRSLVERPDGFAAHITVLLDAFPLKLRVTHVDTEDRTSFVHGLIQDAPRRFVGRGRSYAWARRPMPVRCFDLPETPDVSAMLANILLGMGLLQARALAPQSEVPNVIAVPLLDLSSPVVDSSTDGHSLLYSAHAASTWVLTLDANLGLDYFDTARQEGRTGYLLDFTPEFVATGTRQLLLTTKVDDEIDAIMRHPIADLGLPNGHKASALLMEALRSLSGRLALRLLSAPSQAKGALGMALARLFLQAYGLLDTAIVIPLDAHPELAHYVDGDGPHLRGDLLVVSADVATHTLDFLLVETKCYSGSGMSVDLRSSIAAQLASSKRALGHAFDPHEQDPDRLDRSVQSWRLSTVLTFYLDRALRYNLVAQEAANTLRYLFLHLDEYYQLTIRKVGLVFHPDGSSTFQDREDPDVPIWVFGQEQIHRLIADAIQVDDDQEAHKQSLEDPITSPIMAMTSNATASVDMTVKEEVRRTFENPAAQRESSRQYQQSNQSSQLSETAPSYEVAAVSEINVASVDVSNQVESTARGAFTEEQILLTEPASAHSAVSPPYAVLLGDTAPTPQFGLLGAVAAEPQRKVALDLNGCNTISVFGVQGSGKSYTVGSVLEMALRQLPNLNILPNTTTLGS